jgi:hypothetical protein
MSNDNDPIASALKKIEHGTVTSFSMDDARISEISVVVENIEVDAEWAKTGDLKIVRFNGETINDRRLARAALIALRDGKGFKPWPIPDVTREMISRQMEAMDG